MPSRNDIRGSELSLRITRIAVNDLRTFSEATALELSSGLNVVIGRNNVGKSSLLAAAFWALRIDVSELGQAARAPERPAAASVRIDGRLRDIAHVLRLQLPLGLRAAGANDAFPFPDFNGSLEEPAAVEIGWIVQGGGQTPIFRFLGRSHCLDVLNSRLTDFAENREPFDRPVTLQSFYNLAELSNIEKIRQHFASLVSGWSCAAMPRAMLGGRRLTSADEEEVKQTLTFLRMKHYESAYLHVASEFGRAFPEIQLDFQDLGKYEFRPVFRPGGAPAVELAREAIGSGAWMFLALLTSIRAAYAQGARLLLLDEPHLYLHPSLERQLIRHLTSTSLSIWEHGAPDVLVATHSPEFVEASIGRRGAVFLVNWAMQSESEARVTNVQGSLAELGSVATDLLYARQTVFVEGSSDAAALEELAPGLVFRNRYIPLRTPDDLQKKSFVVAIRAVSNAHAAAPGDYKRPMLLVDADKIEDLRRQWGKWGDAHPEQVFTVVAVGLEGSDFESEFCDARILARLASQLADRQLSDHEHAEIEKLASRAQPAAVDRLKGSQVVDKALELVQAGTPGKLATLPVLASIYAARPREFPAIEKRLSRLMALLGSE